MNQAFDVQLKAAGIALPTPELRFAPPRRWRFDLAWPASWVALEIEGGAYSRGRHTRGAGFIADMEKYNEAAILGWRVIRVTPQQLIDGTALGYIERLITPGVHTVTAKDWTPAKSGRRGWDRDA